jgi:hypothetical protein
MVDPSRLVFIDEIAASTDMMRLGGRCPRGVHLIGRVPHRHRNTFAFVTAPRHGRMTALIVVAGAMYGETSLAHARWRR